MNWLREHSSIIIGDKSSLNLGEAHQSAAGIVLEVLLTQYFFVQLVEPFGVLVLITLLEFDSVFLVYYTSKAIRAPNFERFLSLFQFLDLFRASTLVLPFVRDSLHPQDDKLPRGDDIKSG